MILRYVIACLCLTAFSILASAEFENLSVRRKIDVSGVVEYTRTEVKMKNIGTSAESSFQLSFASYAAAGLGDIVVSKPSSARGIGLRAFPLVRISDSDDRISYKVLLPEPVEEGETVDVLIQTDIRSAMKPIPPEVRENDDQYIKYTGNLYFFSPYRTKTESTTVTLGSSRVTSISEESSSISVKGKVVEIGPYTSTSPFSSHSYSVRFKNNRGFLVAKRAIVQYLVSHWGHIAVREEFQLENVAAKYVGRWSRLENDRRTGRLNHIAHGDVWANLPSDATNVEYKDLIGNVTSSRLREPTRTHRPLQLVFRFPLMGGWKNHFWYTYDILLGNHAISKGANHILTLPIFPSLNVPLLCEKLEVRVLFPEGSKNLQIEPHSSIRFNVSRKTEKATLSYFGRPTMVLSRANLRSDSEHGREMSFRYVYSRSQLLVTPLIVISGIVSFFFIALVYARTQIVLVQDEEEEARLASLTHELAKVDKSRDAFADSYSALDDLFLKVTDENLEEVTVERSRIIQDLTAQENYLREIYERLKAIDKEHADKVHTLLNLLSSKREVSLRFVALKKSFVCRETSLRDFNSRLHDLFLRMHSLASEISEAFCALTDDL